MRIGLHLAAALALALPDCSRDAAPAAAPAPAPPAAVTFDRTTFAAHTRVPIEPGKNVIWCATFQLAWDAIADAVGGGRLDLGAPAPAAEVAELNRRTFPHADLDPRSSVCVGGLVREGVLDRIRTEMGAKFPSEPIPPISAGPEDAVGFSYLAKDLAFEFPFEDRAQPMRFAGGTKYVRAFGLEEDAKGVAAERALGQIVWHGTPKGEAFNNVTELLLASRDDRLLLARMPAPATLEDAWQAVARTLAVGTSQVLKPDGQDLAIPMIDFDATHRFTQFVGVPIGGTAGGSLREATQRLRFRLDKTGAVVRSDAEFVGYLGMDDYQFDVPMLLALLQKGAVHPYLLLWLGNDDFLVSATGPGTTTDLAVLVGTWNSKPKEDRRPGYANPTLTVRADQTAQLEVTVKSKSFRVDGKLEGDGGLWFFTPKTVDGKPASGRQARRMRLERSDAGLSLFGWLNHGAVELTLVK